MPSSSIFREEALRHHLRGGWEGDVLRLPPAWTRWSYPLLVAFAAAGLIVLATGSVRRYCEGPAVVALAGVADVVSPASGVLETLAFREGDRVGAGAVVAVVAAGRTRQPALAPVAGTVHALHATLGRAVAAGQPLLSVAPEPPRFEVVALLPGEVLPHLSAGQRLRVALDASPREGIETRLGAPPRRAVGPAEARRALPAALADVPEIAGPVVPVRVALPEDAVRAQRVPLREGMTGRAEVEVGSERLLFALLPGSGRERSR